MARVQGRGLSQSLLLDPQGQLLVKVDGATVTIRQGSDPASALATVYAGETGGATLTQPLTSENGVVVVPGGGDWWLDPGVYWLHAALGGRVLDPLRIEAYSGVDSARLTSAESGFVNVRAYGATGDGTTDDTTALQAAIDAAVALGGARIVLERGKTYLTNPLKVFSDLILDLNGATLKAKTRVGGTNIWDALVYTAGCTAANGCTGNGVTVVEDFVVENGALDTLGRCYSAVKAQNASRVQVLGVSMPSIQDKIGVRLDFDTDSCVVERCHIVATLDSPFGTITNAQGVSCYSDTGDSTGGAYGEYGTGTVDVVAFNTPTHLSKQHVITNNRIENGTHGVALQGADSCVVANNVFTDTSHRGVIASVSSRCQISDNVVTGQFSCAYLLCFGSRFNVVTGNVAYCTTSVSELNAFRASFGASDNLFEGNYAYGVTGAAFRAFTGSINNTFVGNKAESCGVGLEFRSLVTDNGYQQNVNTPAMNGNAAIGNDFVSCGVGIQLRQGTTTTGGTTPASSAGVAVALSCALIGNRIRSSTGNGVLIVEDTAGVFASNTGVNNCTGFANVVISSGSTDWQTPRGSGHWQQFQANSGGGLQAVHRLPASGNADEWKDSTDVLKALLTSSGAFATAGRHAIGGTTLSTIAMAYLNTTANGQIGYRIDGQTGQTADLFQWTKNAGPSTVVAPLARIDKNGAFGTSVHAAPADADIATGEAFIWLDQTAGAAKLMVKAKNASGTVVTGSLALA